MANDLRGTADIVLDGKTYEVGFSIAALARIAKALECKTFEQVHDRIQKMEVEDAPVIVAALLRGNGHDVPQEISDRMAPTEFLKMIGTLYTSMVDEAPAASDKPRPQKRQRAA